MHRHLAALALFAATPLPAATIFTGDSQDGARIITRLDVADLPVGKHRFLFRGTETGSGQNWLVPILVARGARPGKRVMLIAGVHGDELSSIPVVQQVIERLDPAQMSGVVTAVIGPNRPGLEQKMRYWPLPESGRSLINPNRVFPGREHGRPPERQAWLLWNNVFKDNADVAVDAHTGGTGHDFAFFIFADYRSKAVQTLAELYPTAQILKDPGAPGMLETTFVAAGIPAITLEVGGPRGFDPAIIAGSITGTMNVIAHYGITGQVGRTARDAGAFIGDHLANIASTSSGFTELFITIGQPVTRGQKIALQRNAFGDLLATYASPATGVVAILGIDAMRETGATIAEILTNDPGAPAEHPDE